jgi:DNA invertase Pin-like site-specific DNA recombinase
MTVLDARGIGFKSLSEQIDTTTSGGKLVFHIFGALAEFERELIRERTRAGLAAARARGRQGGRPKKLDTARKLAMAQALYDDGTHSIKDICQTLGISRATLYRAIQTRKANKSPLS